MTEEDYDIMLTEEEDMIRKLTVLHSTTLGRTEKPNKCVQ